MPKNAAGIAPGYTRYGATTIEWAHWSAMPFASDLLPVVCNPRALQHPGSLVDNPFKTPTVYREGKFSGFKGWSTKDSTAPERRAWADEPDYGICVIGRHLHAIDIDVTDAPLARRIVDAANAFMASISKAPLRMRYREGNPRVLLAFAAPTASMVKRRCWFAHGRLEPVEFLANRQHFVIAGQHKDGSRYQWAGGLPRDFPELDIDQANELWNAIAQLAVERSDGPDARHAGNAFMGPAGGARPVGTLTPRLIAERLATARVQLAQRAPSTMNYEEWFAIGAALHHATDGSGEAFALWDAWTSTDDRYAGPEYLEYKWSTMPRAEGDSVVGMGTLVRLTGGDVPVAPGQFPDLSGNLVASAVQADDFEDLIGDAPTAAAPVANPVPSRADVTNVTGSRTARTVEYPIDAGTGRRILERYGGQSVKAERPVATLNNIIAVLGEPHYWPGGIVPHITYDSHAEDMRLDGRPFEKVNFVELRRMLGGSRVRMLPVSDDLIRDAVLDRSHESRQDPIRDYLDSLQWDGTPRLARVLVDYLFVEDSEYARVSAEYLFTGIVARQLDPGHQVDVSMVLIQEDRGGAGKTSLVRALAPAPEYFREFSFDDADEENVRRVTGGLVAENSEMRGIRAADISKIKAFLSRRDDFLRHRYSDGKWVKRRCVIVITGNDLEFARDDNALLRRLAPHVVGEHVDIEGFITVREQVYAEAVAVFKAQGIPWKRLDELAAPHRDAIRIGNTLAMTPLEVAVMAFVNANGDGFTVGAVISALGEDMLRRYRNERTLEMDIGNVLRVLGFQRERVMIDGVRRWRWYRDGDSSHLDDLL